MANLKQNRSGLFYYEGALDGNFATNSLKLKGTCTVLKIACAGADMQFSLTGGKLGSAAGDDIDGTVKAGETLEFNGLEICKLAMRGAGATVRVWAY